MIKINWKVFELFLLSVLIVMYSLICWAMDDKFFLVKLWSWSMLLVVYAFFRLQKHVIIFSPLNLFCLFYTLIPITNFYYIFTDFDSAIFINKLTLHSDYIYLFEMSAFYYLAGLVCILVGYSVIRTPAYRPIRFENNATINQTILNFVVILMLAVGAANFGYNVLSYAGGNLLRYLSTVASRKDEFESTGGTTLGYHCYYMASYLLFYSYLRKRKKADWLLLMIVLGGVVIRASTGRIYGTLSYLLSFIGIFYINNFLNTGRTNNWKFVKYLLPLPLFGATFYFLRLFSGLSVGGTSNVSFGDLLEGGLKVLGFYTFDKGNTPNVAVFMKIIDGWKNDYGYLYGESLFSGIVNNLPSAFKPKAGAGITSFMVRDLWYPNVAGGALPTTAVGEWYMNFGPVGPFVGMFLVGFALKAWYVVVIKSRSYWQHLAYLLISLLFVAIYPKVDFTNLNPFDLFVVFFPMCIVWILTAIIKVKIPGHMVPEKLK